MRSGGYDVQVQYYVDDMGKQEATIVWGYDHLDSLALKPPEIEKPDHAVVEVYRAATDLRKTSEAVEKEISDILNKYEHMDPEVALKFKRWLTPAWKGRRQRWPG